MKKLFLCLFLVGSLATTFTSCREEKSTGDKNEERSIGICKDSVLHKKKVGIHGFTCKKQQFRKFPKRTSKMKKYVKPTKNKQTRKRKN